MLDPNRAVLTVDVLIPDRQGRILLITRGRPPYQGTWCFPGGLVDPGESVEQAGIREVQEETGLTVRIQRLFAVRSAPGRDPRGQYVSIVLIAHPTDDDPQVTEEALALQRFASVPEVMAFDHAEVLRRYFQDPDAAAWLG